MPDNTQELIKEFKNEWRAGNHPSIESFLQRQSTADRTDLLNQLLYHEVAARRERREHPQVEEYLSRLPHDQEHVRDVFARLSFCTPEALEMTQVFEPATIGQMTPHAAEDKTLLFDNRLVGDASKTIRHFDYVLKETTGRFPFGKIVNAEHPGLKRDVRIRILDEEHDRNRSIREGFFAAAQRAAALDDEFLQVSIVEAGHLNHVSFVVERQSDGRPIPDFSDHSKLQDMWSFPHTDLKRMLFQTSSALDTIHDSGLAHGSIGSTSFAQDSISGNIVLCDLGSVVECCQQNVTQIQRNDICQFGATWIAELSGRPLDEFTQKQMGTRSFRRQFASGNRFIPAQIVDDLETFWKSDSNLSSGFRAFSKRLARELERTFVKADWVDRLATCCFEGIFFLFAIAPIFFLASRQLIVGGVLLLVILVVIAPGRRIRGLHLVNRQGRYASILQRTIRFALQLGLIFALTLAAVSFGQWVFPGWAGPTELVFGSIVVGAQIVLYLTSFFLPGRRPIYDYLSCTTWMRRENREKYIDEPLRAFSDTLETPDPSAAWQVKHFEVEGLLGQGGMGAVYKATDTILKRTVALKRVSVLDETAEQRFQQEAQLAAKLSHPNVAQVFGFASEQNQPYLVMEFIPGKTLSEFVNEQGHLKTPEAWNYMRQAASGLKAAYDLGIIHRDIKPSNLMLTKEGQLKVMDFGVSKIIGQQEIASPEEIDASTSENVDMTTTGALLGTPHYMSPEAAQGKTTDCRSDIYSLGLTLYFSLAGHPPFQGTNTFNVLCKQCEEDPPPIQTVRLTNSQQAVLDRMIAKDPNARFGSYDELLAAFQRTSPPRAMLAPLGIRLYAEVLDSIFSWLLAYIVIRLILGSFTTLSQSTTTSIVFMVFQIFGIGLYGWTPGKWLARLRVIGMTRRVGIWQATLRCAAKYPLILLGIFLSTMMTLNEATTSTFSSLTYLILLISAIVASRLASRQTIHDLVASTQVVQYEKIRAK